MRTSMSHAVLAVTVVGLVGIACTDDITPPVTVWDATLLPANEVPAVATGGAGTGTFTLGASNVLTYTIRVTAAPTSPITGAHIHVANVGVNQNTIALWLCAGVGATGMPAGTPTCAVSGTPPYDLVTNGTVTVSTAQLNSMRTFGTYANVHTETNTAGEFRGQLRNVVQ